jgi:hypothetical protein
MKTRHAHVCPALFAALLLASACLAQQPVLIEPIEPATVAVAADVKPSGDGQVYLYSYFNEPNGFDGLHLAWSEDFFNWTEIPGPHFRPSLGTESENEGVTHKIMRDSYLDRGPDGVFHLIWTCAWGGRPDIGYARSTDLVHWTDEKLIPVMAKYADTVENCWAPKMFYDAGEGQWLVFWSSTLDNEMFPRSPVPGTTRNHRIWYVTTRDFESFSPPAVLLDPGYSCIDAAMLKDGEKYYLFFKDERANNAPEDVPQPEYQNIRSASADSPYGPFGNVSATITGENPAGVWLNEGPTPIKLGEWTYVVYDHHGRPQYFGIVRSKDYVDWEDASGMFKMPPRCKHGHIFRVPRASLDALLTSRNMQ